MYTTLITTEQLAGLLANAPAQTVLFDCRFDLVDAHKGRAEYDAGHIPGAHYADLNRNLSAPHLPGITGRHPLPPLPEIVAWLGAMGVGKDTQVVAYDGTGGGYAARLWWVLRWLGHDAVAVLDGGWRAWVAEGRATTTVVPSPTPATFAPAPRNEMIAEAAEVMQAIEAGSAALLDARAADRFRGENETIDPVGGHIPAAYNAVWTENIDKSGHFLSAEALRTRFDAILPASAIDSGKIIAYCGSGVTAAHNVLALTIAGVQGVRLYPGSWSEWITDASRPIAK